jgi:hypothetical protein
LERILDPQYIPTEEDVLRFRVKTTGVVEMPIMVNETTFK